jgi:hypothetical protein
MNRSEPRPVDRLQESKEIDVDAFDARAREEGQLIKEHLAEGTFDNKQSAIGLEYEFYAVDRPTRQLRRVPRSLLGCLGFEKELGLHNAELNAAVQPCNGPGIHALRREVEAKLRAAQRQAATDDIRLVSDGMWTVGPERNTVQGYLTEATHEEGLTLAINVSNAVRYHGFGSMDGRRAIGGHVDIPGVTIEADSAGPVSLTTSIQPHYQCRRAASLPAHQRYALRIAGPLLALGANSPFLPPDLYDDPSPAVLLRDGYAENRIPIYEGMMNPEGEPPKVRFPRDIEETAEAVDRVVEDHTVVPANIGAGERFDDTFVHFRHKHGSYWRWVRPVFDGASRSAANARIEFRPLPGQPTLPDTVAFAAALAGLLTSLTERDHPVGDLSWETARENFYAAAGDGLGADLTWITADGERTTDRDRLFPDLFDAAVDGLRRQGFPAQEATAWIDPLRERVEQRRTPAGWKRRAVATALADGLSPAAAIDEMQQSYIDHQAETLFSGHLTDWSVP